MPSRRTLLTLAAASLLPKMLEAQTRGTAGAPAQPGGELAREALGPPLDGFEAVVTQITVQPSQPGGSGSAHRHTGFVLGYVLEGQLRFGINNEPERIVSAGSTFFEPLGALHSTSGAAGGAPARFLAFMVVPKGSPLVVRER
jgi:quercetin dioxygenase-like cupin family protein